MDGNVDLSKLEVSLTLTNKFEGLETDADDTNSQSLLLRWEHSLGPLGLPGPASWLLWSGHPTFLPDSLTLQKFSPKPNWPSPSCGLSCFPSGGRHPFAVHQKSGAAHAVGVAAHHGTEIGTVSQHPYRNKTG